jgi:acyl-CoA synthetase (AMP-forming)/AMP-acid ligase II
LRQVRSIAAWILAQGLSVERPLVILSDNSVDHALFALAAQHVGVPSAAISPAYSLMSRDFDKLRNMITLLGPGALYVSGTKPFAAALSAIKPLHSAVIVSGNAGDSDVAFPRLRPRRKRRCCEFRGCHRRTRLRNSCSPGSLASSGHQHPAHADVEPAAKAQTRCLKRCEIPHPRLALSHVHANQFQSESAQVMLYVDGKPAPGLFAAFC